MFWFVRSLGALGDIVAEGTRTNRRGPRSRREWIFLAVIASPVVLFAALLLITGAVHVLAAGDFRDPAFGAVVLAGFALVGAGFLGWRSGRRR